MDNTRLIDLIEEYALQIATGDELFTLKSGGKSKYYLDLRSLHLTPEGLHEVVNCIRRELLELEYDAVGGPCVGADPIIGALLYAAPPTSVRGFLVRKAAKEHGLEGRVIGSVRQQDRCVMIEDVVTSGGSTLSAIDAVEHCFGAKVVQVISVVDRLAGGAEAFEAKGIPYKSLLDITDFGLEPT